MKHLWVSVKTVMTAQVLDQVEVDNAALANQYILFTDANVSPVRTE